MSHNGKAPRSGHWLKKGCSAALKPAGNRCVGRSTFRCTVGVERRTNSRARRGVESGTRSIGSVVRDRRRCELARLCASPGDAFSRACSRRADRSRGREGAGVRSLAVRPRVFCNRLQPRIFRDPTPIGEALGAARRLLASFSGGILAEGGGYLDAVERIARPALLQGGILHDARVAALCRYHGVRALWSADRDFSRFPGLSVINPLQRG